jgi:hypothetical protein
MERQPTWIFRIAIGAALATLAPALAAQTFESWVSTPPGRSPGAPAAAGPPAAPVGGLVFFTDRTLFETTCPGLTREEFANTLVGPDDVEACNGPFDATTDNACFAPGGIAAGISFDRIGTSGDPGMAVLTPSFLGVVSVAVGPNFFLDDMVIDFTAPTTAFGAMLECPFAPDTLDIDVIGTGGSLGVTTAVCGPGGNFWGVTSDREILSIELSQQIGGINGELLREVQFGTKSVPTLGGWGRWALIGLLVAISLYFAGRQSAVGRLSAARSAGQRASR